jgi:hypothetical protein
MSGTPVLNFRTHAMPAAAIYAIPPPAQALGGHTADGRASWDVQGCRQGCRPVRKSSWPVEASHTQTRPLAGGEQPSREGEGCCLNAREASPQQL